MIEKKEKKEMEVVDSSSQTLIEESTKLLSEAGDIPNYGVSLLCAVIQRSGVKGECASIHLKQHIQSRWYASPPIASIPYAEKQQIKALIIPALLSSSMINSHLIEAISFVGEHTSFQFVNAWPEFLPQLTIALQNTTALSDYASIHSILALLHSVSRKFTCDPASRPQNFYDDYNYLSQIGWQLWRTFESTDFLLLASPCYDGQQQSTLIECQTLCCNIYYSFSISGLTTPFRANVERWFRKFEHYLTLNYETEELLDGLRLAVCAIFSNQRSMPTPHLEPCLEAVWSLLLRASSSTKRPCLTFACVKFLAHVCIDPYKVLVPFFARDDVLHQIIQGFAMSNGLLLTDEDEELFQTDYVEFMRKDREGRRPLDTWRRVSSALLWSLALSHRDKVFPIVSQQIRRLLALVSQNPPANWKYKECALYVVILLGTKNNGSLYSTAPVDIPNFFASYVVHELRSQDDNEYPILKARALHFFTTFCSLIPKPVALAAFPSLVRLLNSNSNVVHSYAASCIEKLLLVNDDPTAARYTSADIGLYLPDLFHNLFLALEKPGSEENQYVMKCILLLISVVEISAEVISPCISGVANVLKRVCESSQNTTFKYRVSKAAVVFVRRACDKNPSVVSSFEESLLPSLQFILSNGLAEFFPCAFHLLAQFVKLNVSPILPPHYIQLFPIVLLPEFWDKLAYVPGLVRLLRALLRKAPNELKGEAKVQVINITKDLIESKHTEELGIYLLNTVVEILDYKEMAPYLSCIWTLLLARLRNNMSLRFDKYVVVFMSLFLVKYGAQKLANAVDAVEPGRFIRIIEHVWIPNLQLFKSCIEVKLISVASCRLLYRSKLLKGKETVRLRKKLIEATRAFASSWRTLEMVEPRVDAVRVSVEEEPQVLDAKETFGYHATWEKDEDPVKEISSPMHYFIRLAYKRWLKRTTLSSIGLPAKVV